MTNAKGRRSAVDEARNLFVLWGVLSDKDSTLSSDTVAKRLGISTEAAVKLMDLLITARGDETDYLPLYSRTEDPTHELSAIPQSKNHGRAVRLTKDEGVALTAALNQLGIPEDDPIRRKLDSYCSSNKLNASEIERTIATAAIRPDHDVIRQCSAAIVDSKELMFEYQGSADQNSKARTVLPKRLWTDHKNWFLDAYDRERGEIRSFRTDRMANLKVFSTDGQDKTKTNAIHTDSTILVKLYFDDPAFLTTMDWPGLELLHSNREHIVARIPYYTSSTWLPRQVAACCGNVFTDDPTLNTRIDEYVQIMLEDTRDVRQDIQGM